MSRQLCKFCNNTFASQKTLQYHQKKNKACLDLQIKLQKEDKQQEHEQQENERHEEQQENDQSEEQQENEQSDEQQEDEQSEEQQEDEQSEEQSDTQQFCKYCSELEIQCITYRSQIIELEDKLCELQSKFDKQLVKSMLEIKQMSAFIQTFCMPSNSITKALFEK